jgi:ABC-2 type transport system ATP-binding protein
MQNEPVVRVDRLHKVYGPVIAVDDISFEVKEHEIFGIVGPNGAGKTTTIECIEGLRNPDSGQIQVLGLDPQRNGYILRSRIGIQFQNSALQERIKVWEALELFSSFYLNTVNWEILLEKLGLSDNKNKAFSKLSGGQKQRLFIALALVNDPELVFLDELTTGLDPQARRATWDMIKDIRKNGKTIFFTTHFMEEAERLCDRVAIMNDGKIVALDSPANLIRNSSIECRIVFTILENIDMQLVRNLKGVNRVEQIGEQVIVYGNGNEFLSNVLNVLTSNNIKFRDLRTEQPNLEDVFLSLTGKEIKE